MKVLFTLLILISVQFVSGQVVKKGVNDTVQLSLYIDSMYIMLDKEDPVRCSPSAWEVMTYASKYHSWGTYGRANDKSDTVDIYVYSYRSVLSPEHGSRMNMSFYNDSGFTVKHYIDCYNIRCPRYLFHWLLTCRYVTNHGDAYDVQYVSTELKPLSPDDRKPISNLKAF